MPKKTTKSSGSSMRDKAKKKAERNMNRGKSSYLDLPEGGERLKVKKNLNIDVLPYTVSVGNHPEVEKGEQWYQRTFFLHYLDNKPYICPKTIKKPCPVCEHVKALFNSEDEADTDLAKQMKAKERELYNVIDLDDQDKGVQLFEVSYHLFGKALDEEINEGEDELGGFAELSGGKSLTTKWRSKKLGKNEFLEIKSITFEDRDDYEEDILDDVIDLDTILVVEEYDTLQKAIYGLDEDEEAEKPDKKSKKKDEDDEDEDDEKPEKKAPSKRTSKKEEKKRTSKKDKDDDDPDEDEDDEDDSGKDKKKPGKKESKKDTGKKKKCPHGGKFGVDAGDLDLCDDCKLFGECADADEEEEDD